ncbi:MAG: hypothetical protein JEY91_06180 [Spirochaetaceae bacterium]|nr:hypothetical protein [Spirochaetaceae bacterium]
MSITPLDLQTLFVRLNQVGKEQNHLKEAVASQQAAGARQIKEEEIRQDHSVGRTEEDRETQKLKDEEKHEHNRESSSGKEDEDENERLEAAKKKIFHDPQIGSHIDISG